MTPTESPAPPAADIDDPAVLGADAAAAALDAIAGSGGRARAAISALAGVDLSGPRPDAVVVAGMGGSGVAGDLLAALAFPCAAVPVVVVKGDRLPGFVGPSTLLVAVSYSGETDETVAAVEQGAAAGARMVVVASGGRLARLAADHGAPLVGVPSGLRPRDALWSMVVPVLGAAEAVGVLHGAMEDLSAAAGILDAEATALGPAVPAAANPAKQAGRRLLGKLPVVWGTGQLGAVAATRFRTQINENAKLLALSAAVPEADHNEVEGVEHGAGPRQLVLLRDRPGEHERDDRRLRAVLADLPSGDDVIARVASAGPPLARFATLVAFADFTSTYLAIARGVDPTVTAALQRVKNAVAGGRPSSP